MKIVSSHVIKKMMAKGDTTMYITMYSVEGSEPKEDMSPDL